MCSSDIGRPPLVVVAGEGDKRRVARLHSGAVREPDFYPEATPRDYLDGVRHWSSPVSAIIAISHSPRVRLRLRREVIPDRLHHRDFPVGVGLAHLSGDDQTTVNGKPLCYLALRLGREFCGGEG